MAPTTRYLLSPIARVLLSPSLHQLNLALMVASTSMVPAGMRGKLSGLFSMTENLGRFLGPPVYATAFALSISPSAYD